MEIICLFGRIFAPLMQDSDMNMVLRLAGFSRCADSSHPGNLGGDCVSPAKLELHCMRLASRDAI